MRIFVGLIALSEAGKCEDKGGKCVDWRTEVGFSKNRISIERPKCELHGRPHTYLAYYQ